MKMNFKGNFYLVLLIIFSCNSGDDPQTPQNPQGTPEDPPVENSVIIVNAFPQLSFSHPVDLQSPADNSNRIFIAEQRGIISTFNNDPNSDTATVFLDIENQVFDGENEMGLLGFAFHPNFVSNGFFYVSYTPTRNRSVVSRFQASGTDLADVDISSEQILLEIPQPFSNHNGGQLAFDADGLLYISSGDGGSGGDPQGNAQNTANLLGAILRIDVDVQANGLNYGIPEGNPFVSSAVARPEIYAYGLRNPWRISFDSATGLLWAGDVGQGELEEIDIIVNGGNFGWNIQEGSRCFEQNSCDSTGLIAPVFEYNHNQGDVSVTGGYVYRGNAIPELQGRYVYGDFESGRIWTLAANATPGAAGNELLLETNLNIASFGVDSSNELFICSFDGRIYRFELEN